MSVDNNDRELDDCDDDVDDGDDDDDGFTLDRCPACGMSPAWCSWAYLDPCGGTGVCQCYCGGDQCVCHNHGEVQCDGCEDCDGYEGDYYDDDYED